MPTSPALDLLESRRLYSGSVDSTFAFDRAALEAVTGPGVRVYDAVAGPGDRTYLLASRVPAGSKPAGPFDVVDPDRLTIVAVDKAGRLDRTFNGDGVLLSDRHIVPNLFISDPALLRVDTFGRLYVIDNERVLRFRPDGAPDLGFGRRGAVSLIGTFAGTAPDKPPQTQDALANDDGSVSLATLYTRDGIQHSELYAVTAAGPRRVYGHAYDTGNSANDDDGSDFPTGVNAHVRLTRTGDVIGMTIVDTHANTPEDYIDSESGEPATTIRQDGQQIHVVSFGRGLRKIAETDIEPTRPLESVQLLDTFVSPTGKTMLVLGDHELLRLGLKDQTRRRTALPPSSSDLSSSWAIGAIAPDGRLYLSEEVDTHSRDKTLHEHRVLRLHAGGGADRTFAARGTLAIPHTLGGYGYEGTIDAILFGTRSQAPYLFSSVNGDDFALRRLTV